MGVLRVLSVRKCADFHENRLIYAYLVMPRRSQEAYGNVLSVIMPRRSQEAYCNRAVCPSVCHSVCNKLFSSLTENQALKQATQAELVIYSDLN